jgi:hypothetical protein
MSDKGLAIVAITDDAIAQQARAGLHMSLYFTTLALNTDAHAQLIP